MTFEKLDQLEAAELLTSNWQAANIEAVRANVPTERDISEDEVVECELCGDTLPHLRAVKGFTTCVSCQHDIEKRSKRCGKSRYSDYE